MNSRNLIIAFVTVSIVSLVVSCLAVISVARTYSAALASESEAESVSVREQTSAPAEESTEKLPETEVSTREETSAAPETSEETEAETSDTVSVTEAAETTSEFILSFSSDRLIITDPEGEIIYERLMDSSDLHPKDLEALLIGISFPEKEAAMSAVYDLIS